ncbi:Dyp-type peroxidase [Polychaeton citri CBS 116435]|uniref:Dyp-type peroxidase n=1 Tax=Polychaeton citri CBS 116435 TaxID=1314669 RepID=A0A9P4QBC8_9PEZI|nr:Dyp-type peroxidase [Polychaeton citri CBS 116435]
MPATKPLNVNNVQGDILFSGLPKLNESFFFFKIEDARVRDFCQALRQVTKELSASNDTTQARSDIQSARKEDTNAVVKFAGANIAFTMKGLQQMKKALPHLNLKTNEIAFEEGMKVGAGNLHDPFKAGTTEPAYEAPWSKPESIHGLILVAGSDPDTVKTKLQRVQSIFNFPTGKGPAMVSEVTTIKGKVRPGEHKGHEHFGFEDGISQPAVQGVDRNVPPGQDTVSQGVILCGREGDFQQRPDWMVDGSFLVFRKLAQKVPEWNQFLVDASNTLGTWSGQLGSRLVGRWPSGCPINLSPDFDNVALGKDPLQNNKFEFDDVGDNFKCPMGAHIRKTNPRGDLSRGTVNQFRILRRGIPFGEEVDVDPKGERGLLFVCYQSQIGNGFQFIQQTWANQPTFFSDGAGLDAIMGQSNTEKTVDMKGLFPQDANRPLPLNGINRFVIPKGGEYFFSPSIPALNTALSDVAKTDL